MAIARPVSCTTQVHKVTARKLEVVIRSVAGARNLSLDEHLDVEYDRLPIHCMSGLVGISWPDRQYVTFMNAGGFT